MPDTKTLKFVTLLGSLRAESFHRGLARALPALAPAGVTIEPLASIGDFPIYDADLQANGFPDAAVAMGEAIASADGVIVVTPEYNYSVPGGLKNALDWLSRLPSAPLARKPIAIQSGSPGTVGGSRAQYHLRQVFVFLDSRVLNKPEVMIPMIGTKIDTKAGTIIDDATRGVVAQQLQAFKEFVS